MADTLNKVRNKNNQRPQSQYGNDRNAALICWDPRVTPLVNDGTTADAWSEIAWMDTDGGDGYATFQVSLEGAADASGNPQASDAEYQIFTTMGENSGGTTPDETSIQEAVHADGGGGIYSRTEITNRLQAVAGLNATAQKQIAITGKRMGIRFRRILANPVATFNCTVHLM
jgi:hypothetical protein